MGGGGFPGVWPGHRRSDLDWASGRDAVSEADRGQVKPETRHRYRAGDICHCYADITKARRLLGREPRVSLQDGLADLLAWVEQQMAEDRFSQEQELKAKSLVG